MLMLSAQFHSTPGPCLQGLWAEKKKFWSGFVGNDFAGLLSKKVPLNTFPLKCTVARLNLSKYQLGKVKEVYTLY